MFNTRLVIAAILLGTLAACTQAPPPALETRAADEKAIRDVEAVWNQAWTTRDGAKIATYWADDATLMIPGIPAMHGHADIEKGMKEMLGDPALSLKFEADKVEAVNAAGLGYTQGHYEMVSTDAKTKKPMVEKGKYLTVYRKQADGTWKAIEDINNADGPATPQK